MITTTEKVVINHRFCGPPNSGNGGYSCGVMGIHLDGTVEATLFKPPPLDTEMDLLRENGHIKMILGEEVIGQAHRVDKLDLTPPPPVSFDRAVEASKHYHGFNEHLLPTCFVCGPDREEGDALRIFAGELNKEDVVYAPWIPDESLGDEEGYVKPIYLWAALDCPGYFSLLEGKFIMALLGRLTAEVPRKKIKVGEKCVVVGWKTGQEGRKHYCGTAVYNEAGEIFGKAKAIWVELKQAAQPEE